MNDEMYLSIIECPRCRTPNHPMSETCRFCHCPLRNWCIDSDCETLNKPTARFCKICGKRTLFNKNKVFDEAFCDDMREEAILNYKAFGERNLSEEIRKREEYRRMKEMESWYFSGCPNDFPEPPIEEKIFR